jgi:cysteinyl-tRNA synthetase
LASAHTSLERLKTTVINLTHRLEHSVDLAESKDVWLEKAAEYRQKFIEEMNDDFNTANAIAVLFDLSRDANLYLQSKNTSVEVIRNFIALFNEIGNVLGLNFDTENQELLDEDIEALIEKRNKARNDKDFELADKIRNQLKEQNIILEDTPQGLRWKRK